MGNRAVITTKHEEKNNGVGVYLHWNGGIESIEAFLAYCEIKKFRCPEDDNYGWAYLCTVIGNYFGDGLSLGIDKLERLDTDNGDNGVYYIEDWKVIGRSYNAPLSTDGGEMYERLVGINESQGPSVRVDNEVIKQYCEDKGFPTD